MAQKSMDKQEELMGVDYSIAFYLGGVPNWRDKRRQRREISL